MPLGSMWRRGYFPIDSVHVGANTYGPLKVIPLNQYDGQLYIGAFCSISGGVTFLLGGEHDYHNVSTYPFKACYLQEGEATASPLNCVRRKYLTTKIITAKCRVIHIKALPLLFR